MYEFEKTFQLHVRERLEVHLNEPQGRLTKLINSPTAGFDVDGKHLVYDSSRKCRNLELEIGGAAWPRYEKLVLEKRKPALSKIILCVHI